jgi:hypothetical protein
LGKSVTWNVTSNNPIYHTPFVENGISHRQFEEQGNEATCKMKAATMASREKRSSVAGRKL